MTEVDRFEACFRGGTSSLGGLKYEFYTVKVYDNGDSYVKKWGKRTLLEIFRPKWHKGIVDINGRTKDGSLKYPYEIMHVQQGNTVVPVHLYPHSLQLEPSRESMNESVLHMENQRLSIMNMEAKQQLSDTMSRLNDSTGDRFNKRFDDEGKRYKKLRSYFTFNDYRD